MKNSILTVSNQLKNINNMKSSANRKSKMMKRLMLNPYIVTHSDLMNHRFIDDFPISKRVTNDN